MNTPVNIASKTRLHDIIQRPRQVEQGLFLSLDYIRDNGPDHDPVLVAVDNTTGEAWTEEFDSVSEAIKWLRGKEPRRADR